MGRIERIKSIDGKEHNINAKYLGGKKLEDITKEVDRLDVKDNELLDKININTIEISKKADKSEIPSLDEYAKTSEIPTKTSQLENDDNFANKTYVDNSVIIVKGGVDNSAVLKGEYEVNSSKYSNKAISQISTSFGAATTAGLKGWYYTKVNLSSKSIWLSKERTVNKILGIVTGLKIEITTSTKPDDTSFVSGWKVGDLLTIVNGRKYERCATIAAINGNMITLDKLPFDSETIVKTASALGDYNEPDEFSITSISISDNDILKTRNVSSYDKGDVDFGGGAHAEGVQTYAINIGAHAEGIQTIAYGQFSHTEGFRTESAYSAHAEGYCSKATGQHSHAEGNQTVAQGQDSHAEGKETAALGIQSHAEGQWSKAIGAQSHAEGESCEASGNQSHAEGYSTMAVGGNSHAEGNTTVSRGSDSHAEGNSTTAYGNYSHAEGFKTVAYGNYSHAEGFGSLSLIDIDNLSGSTYEEKWDNAADAEKFNMAYGKQSHVEGNGNIAIGDRGHAEGIFTKAKGTNSHAEGQSTVASGLDSHAEGKETVASGACAHAGGLNSIASKKNSFVHGEGLKVSNEAEVAFGKYNKSESDTIFSIGYGESDSNRSNIFEIKKSSLENESVGYLNGKKILVDGDNNWDSDIESFKEGLILELNNYTDSKLLFNSGTGEHSAILKDSGSKATNSNTVAIGLNTTASGENSFVMGNKSSSTGLHSFAGGLRCESKGNGSIAFGQDCATKGKRSFALGRYVVTTNDEEFACGLFNESNSDTCFSVGIGTSDDVRKNALEIKTTGEAIFSSSITATAYNEPSDERLKIFKSDINVDLDKLAELRKSYFTFIEDPGTNRLGVSAQEIQELYPEIVTEGADGFLKVDYSKLSVIALKAIDILHNKNKELEDRLNKIEKMLNL